MEKEELITKVTAKNFDEITKDEKLTVIDFYAEWCPPCRVLSPTVAQLAYEFRNKVKFGKLDVDESPKICKELRISSVPTLIFFKSGKQLDRITGAVPKQEIEKIIYKHIR